MEDSPSSVLILGRRYRRLMALTLCLIALMLAQTAYTIWATRPVEPADRSYARAA